MAGTPEEKGEKLFVVTGRFDWSRVRKVFAVWLGRGCKKAFAERLHVRSESFVIQE